MSFSPLLDVMKFRQNHSTFTSSEVFPILKNQEVLLFFNFNQVFDKESSQLQQDDVTMPFIEEVIQGKAEEHRYLNVTRSGRFYLAI